MPALVGLEVVVVLAEPGELIDLGLVGESPGGDVVDFEVGPGVAARNHTVGVTGNKSRVLAGGDVAAEVDDVVDVVVFVLLCDDGGEEGVGGVVPGEADGDGSDAVDFTGFAWLEVPTSERGVIDANDDGGGWPSDRWRVGERRILGGARFEGCFHVGWL